MNAVPTVITGTEIDATGNHACPLCGVQRTGDVADTGWVYCPMIEGQAICLGCCLDYQRVARTEDFSSDPFCTLFTDLAASAGIPMDRLRSACLRHQADLLMSELGGTLDDADRQVKTELLAKVKRAMCPGQGKIGPA